MRRMLKASFVKYLLHFKRPAKTSRNTLTDKPSWFLLIEDSGKGISATGECSLIPGLSPDNLETLEQKLTVLVNTINTTQQTEPNISLNDFPSLRFGLETAVKDLQYGGIKKIYDTDFFAGTMSIPINGLVWMGDFDFMKGQVKEKLDAGFDCIKIKIGALGFEDELSFLRNIRKEYGANIRTLRLDANGAFEAADALEKLKQLSELDIHSIEQPIKAGQWQQMAELCTQSPIHIALDEELIRITSSTEKEKMLATVNPAYIILKPSLIGGFRAANEWIDLATRHKVGWWATSALESDIGLNAIAQWCSSHSPTMPQGLGTGGLYTNNIESPLKVVEGRLWYRVSIGW